MFLPFLESIIALHIFVELLMEINRKVMCSNNWEEEPQNREVWFQMPTLGNHLTVENMVYKTLVSPCVAR